MAQHFPPIRYVVEGVIPEGLSLIVAPPKFGKSWLMLSLGLACSSGTNAFGVIPTGKSRPVLYAALEDGQRRLKARIQLLAPDSIDTTLHFITKLSRDDVIPTLQAFVDKWHNHQPLIILDTLGKVMPPAIGGESSYERDYRVGGALKAIADSAPGAAVLVVHHTRKAEGSDFIDSVSGTQGLAGSADTIIVLSRDRMSKQAVLRVTSRDAAEGEYAIQQDDGHWSLVGNTLAEASAAVEQRRAAEGVGDRMSEILTALAAFPDGARPAEIASRVGLSADDAGRYLRRAADAGRAEKKGRGLYTPVRSVRVSDPSETPFGQTDTTDTPLEGITT